MKRDECKEEISWIFEFVCLHWHLNAVEHNVNSFQVITSEECERVVGAIKKHLLEKIE